MQSSKISSDKAPKPVGLYPHARKVGNLLFLSGVGPWSANSDTNDSAVPGLELDHNGNFISFDFEAQCHSVFQNIRIILEESGSSWENLVDVTVFLVNMKRDFQTYNKNTRMINEITNNNPDLFLDRELEIRRKNKLPPYERFISLILTGENEKKLEKDAFYFKTFLEDKINAKVLGPGYLW